MLDPLRRIYIISKRRALSGRDVEIRHLNDTDLLFINYMYNDAGEIRDFDSWAAIVRAILPEIENITSVPTSAPEQKQENKNAVEVKPTKLLYKLATSLRTIIPSSQKEATPEEILEWEKGTRV